MLIDILTTYMNRIGVDCDFSAVKEASDDYIDVTDPDINFGDVRQKILADTVLSKRLVNQTVASLELFDTMWDNEGNKINISVILSIGDLGFGLKAKAMVRTIDTMINGNVKSFLSIEAYNNYINSIAVGV